MIGTKLSPLNAKSHKIRRSSLIGRRSSVIGRRSSVIGRRSGVIGRRSSVRAYRVAKTHSMPYVAGHFPQKSH